MRTPRQQVQASLWGTMVVREGKKSVCFEEEPGRQFQRLRVLQLGEESGALSWCGLRGERWRRGASKGVQPLRLPRVLADSQ